MIINKLHYLFKKYLKKYEILMQFRVTFSLSIGLTYENALGELRG